MLVNRFNIIRWDDGNAPSTIESDLPTGYVQDPSRCSYKPLLAAGEAMRFFINAFTGLSFIEDPNVHLLALVKENGTVVNADVATLQVLTYDTTDGPVSTFYAEVVIDGSVTPGTYYFQIKDGATVALTSNKFYVVPAGTDHQAYSSLVKVRHDRVFYGVRYPEIGGFYQQFRLHFNEIEDQFEGDKEVYNEVTTGKQRTYNNFMRQVKKIEAYYFDALAHEAAAVLFDHDEIFINLKQYTAKGAYKIVTNSRSKISKGEIELYNLEFASANRCNS